MDGALESRDRALTSRAAAPLLLAPALLLFAGLFVYPQFYMLAASLNAPRWSLANYAHFLGDFYYLGTLLRSLLLGASVTGVTVALGLPLAYWLARTESRVAPILVLVSTFPLWVSAVVRSFGWIILLGRNGLISDMLRAAGLVGRFFQLLQTFGGVVIALAQVLLPLMVLSLYGLIRGIDPELERAAQNLGASPFRAVLLTTLPLARQGLISASLLIFALSISAFATPSLVGGPRVPLMSTTIYEQMTELANWRFAAAVSFILMAVVLAIVLVNARFSGAAGEMPGR